jgi:hypothetical protein
MHDKAAVRMSAIAFDSNRRLTSVSFRYVKKVAHPGNSGLRSNQGFPLGSVAIWRTRDLRWSVGRRRVAFQANHSSNLLSTCSRVRPIFITRSAFLHAANPRGDPGVQQVTFKEDRAFPRELLKQKGAAATTRL